MSALAGKAPYGSVTGLMFINDHPDSLERYRKVMGYVPQDDVMHRMLTVEENFYYSAQFRWVPLWLMCCFQIDV